MVFLFSQTNHFRCLDTVSFVSQKELRKCIPGYQQSCIQNNKMIGLELIELGLYIDIPSILFAWIHFMESTAKVSFSNWPSSSSHS